MKLNDFSNEKKFIKSVFLILIFLMQKQQPNLFSLDIQFFDNIDKTDCSYCIS